MFIHTKISLKKWESGSGAFDLIYPKMPWCTKSNGISIPFLLQCSKDFISKTLIVLKYYFKEFDCFEIIFKFGYLGHLGYSISDRCF